MAVAGSRTLAIAIARACADKKAADILVLDIRRITFLAHFFVIATAESERQSRAVLEAAQAAAKLHHVQPLGREGDQAGAWAVIDFGDVVLHVLTPEARGFYNIEGAWADARRVRWDRSPARPRASGK